MLILFCEQKAEEESGVTAADPTTAASTTTQRIDTKYTILAVSIAVAAICIMRSIFPVASG